MSEQIKQALEEILSPHLEALHGEIKDLTTQAVAQDAKIEALRRGMELVRRETELMRREFLTEIKRIEDKPAAELHRAEEALSTDFTRFEGIVDMRLIAMNEKLEFTRRELLAEMKLAEKMDAAA